MLFRAGAILSLCCLFLRILPVSKLLEMLLYPVLVLEDWGKYSYTTWPNYKGSRFWIFIYSWYGLDEMVELIDAFLNEFFELSGVLSLIEIIIIFSSMVIVEHRFECIELMEIVEICIFTKLLTGTTIQDSSTRERSNEFHTISTQVSNCFRNILSI